MSYNLQDSIGGNFALGNWTLTGLSGAATTYTSVAVPFQIKGRAFTKALVSGGASPTVDGNTGLAMTLTANQAAAFVWGVNAAGTVTVYKGPTQAWTDTSALSTACPLPQLPITVAALAAVVIKGGATTVGTWTFGSSNWNATGIVIDPVQNLGVGGLDVPLITA